MLFQLRSNAVDFADGLNISQFINMSTFQYDSGLLSFMAERYNMSTVDVITTMEMLNLTNATFVRELPAPPSGVPGWLIVSGVAILATRWAIVRLQTRKFLDSYGHAHSS